MSWVLVFLVLMVAATLRLGASSLIGTAQADAMRASVSGVKGASRAADLVERRDVMVQAVAVVHSTLLVVATLCAVWAVDRAEGGILRGAALAGVAVTVVAVGDVIPRVVGRARPGRIGYALSPLVATAIRLGTLVTEATVSSEGESTATEAGGESETQERELISSVLEFSETLVREVMVPRTEMVTLNVGDDLDSLLAAVNEHGFSRFPVIDRNIDDVAGIVIFKDLLGLFSAGAGPGKVGDLLRPAVFVPETKRVSDLLREMQASKVHFVVVIDEYGSTAGVVTLEDLLEELVGEIVDEYDEEEPLVLRLGDHSWQVDGSIDIDELSGVIGVELPDEEWDTVAGLVLGLAGRIPKEKEHFEVAGVSLTVAGLQGRRVTSVRVDVLGRAGTPQETR